MHLFPERESPPQKITHLFLEKEQPLKKIAPCFSIGEQPLACARYIFRAKTLSVNTLHPESI